MTGRTLEHAADADGWCEACFGPHALCVFRTALVGRAVVELEASRLAGAAR